MALRDITRKDFKALAYKSTPKWELLKQQLRQQVLNGDFVPGDALPSETVLCEQSQLARSTVRQALDQLEKEGIIERIQGKGTFVAEFKSNRKHIKTMDVLCLVIPEVARDLYPMLINGFYEGALPINHQVMIATTSNDVYRQGDIMLQIIDKKMAGVAIVPTILKPTPPHHVRQLQNNGIPVVLCHRTVEAISAPLVTWDWKEVGRMAARCFLDHGHQRIGYYGFMRYVMTEQHVEGMQEVLAEKGLMLDENSILFTNSTDSDEEKFALIQKKLAEPDHPTAILCNDDTEAERVYWAAQEMGLKVPGDLAIMGFGNSVREGVIRRRLVSVTVSEFDLGKKAVKLLEEMRSGTRPITNNEVFRMELTLSSGTTV
jgi:GntR family transcriptional regulator, arabinose operon transcriptional repressor